MTKTIPDRFFIQYAIRRILAHMRKVFLFFLFLLLHSGIPAQGFGFRHFTTADGLPQNTVTTTFEDSEGFTWFGTQDGLCRYDGYSFRIFRHEAANPNSLADNYVLSIFEDARHRLWIGCRNGVSTFDRATELFTTMHAEAAARFFPVNQLYFYQLPGEKVKAWSVLFSLEEKNDSTVSITKHNREIVFPNGTAQPVFLTDSSLLTGPQHARSVPFPVKEKVNAWNYGKDGLLRVCLKTVLLFIDPKAASISSVPLPENAQAPFSLVTDYKGQTWLGTAKGVYRLVAMADTEGWKKLDVPGSPMDAAISSLYEDSHHLVWIGTTYAGLFQYDPFSEYFSHATETDLGSKIVWAFYEPVPGELWTGTANGLVIFSAGRNINSSAGKSWSANPAFGETNFRLQPKGLEALNGKTVTALSGTGDSIVWIGTQKEGIYGYNRRTEKLFIHFSRTEKSGQQIQQGTIYCLVGGNKGKLFAGTPSGVAMINLQTMTADSIQPQQLSNGKNHNYIMSVFPDGNDLWIGTSLGFFYYNLATKEFHSYHHDPADPNSFPSDFVSCIVPSPENKNLLYLGTIGGGLILFDKSNKTFRSIGEKEGLLNSTVYGIIHTKDKSWLSTNAGIGMLDRAHGTVQMLTSKDGLGSDEFSQNAWYQSKFGDLFFGSTAGFVCFNPSFEFPVVSPPVVINSIYINYQPVLPFSKNVHGSRSRPTLIELWPGERVLSLEYAGIRFNSGQALHYQFRLSGFDEQWVSPGGNSRMLSYTNLPPGEYTLEIKAGSGNSGKNDSVYALKIRVHPPFYSTWWFRLLAGLLSVSVIAWLVRYFSQRKLRRKLRELEIQQRLQNEREHISRELHDNVGAQLTYIITTLDNVSWKMEKPGNEKSSKTRIEGLSEHARQTMHQLRESIWAINSSSVSTQELAKKTQEFMQRLGENAEDIQTEVLTEGTSVELKPSLAIEIFRIVQEAVSNAIRHSGGTNVTVRFSSDAEQVRISVSDNGKGFAPGAEYTGHYGLKNMPARAARIGAEFSIESATGKGTTILLVVPLRTN